MSVGNSVPLTTKKWRIALADAIDRLDDPRYVSAGVDALRTALEHLSSVPFVQEQLMQLARASDEASLAVILAGRIPLSKGRDATLDDAWSLKTVEDRNDRWIIQQWMFVRECVYDWKHNGSFAALSQVLPWLRSWIGVNLSRAAIERGEELNWHDHAVALRAINLIWLASMLRAAPLAEGDYLPMLFKLIEVHTAVLAAQDFYSVGTNHGFDQGYALYFLSAAFPITDSQLETKAVGRDRLLFELDCAFNEEGVHIENSPSYHVIMMVRLLKAEMLLGAFECAEIVRIDPTVEKAMTFLTHALKPNGTLPLLGDTEALPLRFELAGFQHLRGFSQLEYAFTAGRHGEAPRDLTAVFPKSGYAFLRDRWPSQTAPDCLHLAFKCGFLSTYHRHDDDNTILLFASGEDWLVGSGIYKYHEQDQLRRYLRSAQAQNILSVDDLSADRNLKEAQSSITSWSNEDGVTTVTGSSRMFPGTRYERRVSYDRPARLITLNDTVAADDEATHDFVLRFHIPTDRLVEIIAINRVKVTSRRSGMSMFIEIMSSAPDIVDVITGQTTPTMGWTSPQRSAIEPAQTVCFKTRGAKLFQIVSRLSFI